MTLDYFLNWLQNAPRTCTPNGAPSSVPEACYSFIHCGWWSSRWNELAKGEGKPFTHQRHTRPNSCASIWQTNEKVLLLVAVGRIAASGPVSALLCRRDGGGGGGRRRCLKVQPPAHMLTRSHDWRIRRTTSTVTLPRSESLKQHLSEGLRR